MLTEIGNQIRIHNEEFIVAGDFYAKSPQWEININDRRGCTMTERIDANNLVIVNQDRASTLKRQDYTSILDLTFVRKDIKPSVTKWAVMEDASVSVHYITLLIRIKA